MGKTISSINDTGKTEQPCKRMKADPYFIYKLTYKESLILIFILQHGILFIFFKGKSCHL